MPTAPLMRNNFALRKACYFRTLIFLLRESKKKFNMSLAGRRGGNGQLQITGQEAADTQDEQAQRSYNMKSIVNKTVLYSKFLLTEYILGALVTYTKRGNCEIADMLNLLTYRNISLCITYQNTMLYTLNIPFFKSEKKRICH